MERGGGEVVEEASPISSRPPANLEELMSFSAADGGGGGGGGGSSSSGGNRWPREETLALLRIRSDMDSIFRDATLKAPLWEDVSRKLSELGYKRSAKKCKEKFENVQKYYKRTKEARGGRQDGKAYKFFSQLEALNNTSTTLDVAPLSVANPIPTPFSSSSPAATTFTVFPPPPPPPQPQQMASFASTPITPAPPPAAFSSHSSSTASGMGSDGGGDYDMDVDVADVAGPSRRSRKRKRKRGGSGEMMEFFEGLVRQVLRKQDAMQRSFLEALEKRERERIEREEAWKRQEISRLSRDREILARERAASASRDAAIVSLVQNLTGHTIHLPPPPPPPPPPSVQQPQPPQPSQPPLQQRPQVAEPSNVQSHQLQPIMAIPEQQIPPPPLPPPPPQPSVETEKLRDQMGGSSGGGGGAEPASSSRWPKAEVLALINLRSGLEPRYQETGPKGPLWEEISGAMRRMGYNRSAKRCKEKWENINKYYKKVKESNKQRPEDAKTCPYFHRLDSLYRSRVLGGSTTSGVQDQAASAQKESGEAGRFSASKPLDDGVNVQRHGSDSSTDNRNEQHMEEECPREGAFRDRGEEKPEDLVRELMMQQEQQQMVSEYGKIEKPQSYDLEEEEDEEEEIEEDEKAGYEIAFQGNTNRGSSSHAEPSFLTMVQ